MSTTLNNANSNVNNLNPKSASSSLNGGSPSNKSVSSINNSGQANIAHNTPNHSNTAPKHWSQKKHESCISSQCIEKSNFLSKLRGGSDSGQFIYLDASLITTNSSLPMDTSMGNHQLLDTSLVIQLLSGKLYPGEIILEIQGKKVSGFTLYDVISWLKQLAKSYQSITLRTVKSSSYTASALSNNPNSINISTSSNSSCSSTQSQSKLLLLPYELRQYLDERFQKGSIDYDLQQIIRENVYMRTVPCTTRLPRQGEIHGQDYIFLTNDEFLEMEQNGDLLEYGVYNGHYYGTPKPPKEPKINNNMNNMNNTNNTQASHNQQQSTKQSLSDMTSMLNLKQSNSVEDNEANEVNANTEITNTTAHQLFNQNSAENSELIPYGWEKVEDPEYGTFYIDHINKQTTYENPFMQQQLLTSSMKTFKPNSNSVSNLNNNSSSNTPNINHINNPEEQNEEKQPNNTSQMQLTFNSSNRRNIFFTQNPNELKGEFFKTALLKTSHGFGFTIIGANETSEDFLQIKFVVPDGAADRDGCLRQGDVLVYVNNECVLGYTHQDVVEIFQSIPVGNSVELTVCRGYPLSIDPNDPNIEMVPLAAINNPNNATPAPLASGDELTGSSLNNSNMNQIQFQQKQEQLDNMDNDYYCEEYEEMYAAIVKGPKGFGFTIADDSQMNHQKVKQILDRDRCINLLENDILLEINGIQLKNFNHNQVVDVLKECVKGKETIIKLKRRKYSISLPSRNSSTNLNGTNATNVHNHIGISTNAYSPSTNQSITPNNNFSSDHKSNGIKNLNQMNQSPLENENEEFRPISSLNKSNGQHNQQAQRELNQQQFSTFSNSANPNQVAFNYERRSKTPNILQSNSQSNCFMNNNIYSTKNQAVPMGGNMGNTSNQYQPQLRSKTPTTDRLLFQHTHPENQFENGTSNDYIYLNSTNNNNINSNSNNLNGKRLQSQHNRLDTLYSTVNKSTRTPVNIDECDFAEKKDNIENIAPNANLKEHMPIYDSTTNIQHQRVIQNLNRFNHHQQQQQIQQQQQQQQYQQQQQFYDIRSKTPGPDVCYFRDNNVNSFKQSSNQYFNQNTGYSKSGPNNFVNGSQINLRSKTPTADMMYYQSSSNNNGLLKRGNTSHAISSNFDNIYQPFGNSNNNEINTFNEINNIDDMKMINTNGGIGQNPSAMSETITSDVDGNSYIETVIDLYRQESGFGFRIVGGEEEGSQVAVGYIVQGGSAHVDGRLRPSDEIIMIDNECVLGATHRKVVQLMTIAGLNRKVKLMIRRKINGSAQMASVSSNSSNPRFMSNNSSGRTRELSINPAVGVQSYPYTITLFRNGNEGFGFVIISTANKNGPSIGKIVENSPADRCKRLNVGDRILAVNSINIIHMNHIEIVKLIKESGNSITLTIGHPLNSTPPQKVESDHFFMNNENSVQSKSNSTEFGNLMQPGTAARLSGRNQFVSPQLPNQPQNTKAIINQNEYHVIELRKQQQGGFGFSIRGGKEFNIPLFVLKLADMGPALLDGRLQVGDQILEINSCDAYQMTHSEAIDRIKSGGNLVTLLIRRTGLPPPSITDIIAANATAAVNNAHQQQYNPQAPVNSSNSPLLPSNSSNNLANTDMMIQQQLRSKSPYLQHHTSYNDSSHHVQQFKNFNSSGSLMNRNH